ncbi:MAG: shikimate kinase [Myxococcota bacterium]
MRPGVALVGFMGSGKSSVGRALAERLGWPLVDLDEVLVARYGPIAEQVRRDGLARFRAREREAALALCDGVQRVLATGGGTFEDDEVRAALRAAYRTVFLDVPLEAIAARIGAGAGRPLWDAEVPARYAARLPRYREAEHALRCGGDPDAWAARIVRDLGLEGR